MRIDVGTRHTEYLSGIATLALAVYCCYTAAAIGQGPVCLLLYLMALICLPLGATLLVRCLLNAERDYTQRLIAESRRQVPARKDPAST